MASEDDLWRLVAAGRQGVLATGRPQLSNVLYLADAARRVLRISTTARRVKARNLARDPRAALHVSGGDFWQYAVAEGTATLSAVASVPMTMPAVSCWQCIRPATANRSPAPSARR
jgi:PPOX class probable F420-dependent enzyme